MWVELILRFLIGGIVVSGFAVLGDMLHPKSFAGIFAAAPSVALATLGITIAKHGGGYAALEGRSMIAGAAALLIYCWVCSLLMLRRKLPALAATSLAMILWLVVAFGLYALFL